ncbi:MAG TPA: DinB family protein [Gemmatimonadales bacterium]|nr:DinB family protein [Gemmatimonadales bacterium]
MTSVRIERPEPTEYAPHYGSYIDAVPDGDPLGHLERQLETTHALLAPIPPERARFRYAPGKWSVVQVIGHLIDAERIFAYRALRFARADRTELPGFDENAYVAAGGFEDRPFASVLDELAAVRGATIALFGGLDPDALRRQGVANGHPVSVRALLYIILGHERHHLAVLRGRYGIG